MADEWTFVSHQKTSKRRGNRHNGKGQLNATSKHQKAHGSGLYRASIEGGTSSKQLSKNKDDGVSISHTKFDGQKIKSDILECLHALENQLKLNSGSGSDGGGNGFAHRLISSVAMATTASVDADKTDQPTAPTPTNSTLPLREIVAYGIGNFATGSCHAPMLQLACLLLLRRCAAIIANTVTVQQSSDDDKNTDSFKYEQQQVPIFYYEPDILPIEKELLESTFHVHVLDSNEMGKRTVEMMREEQQQKDLSSSSSTTMSAEENLKRVDQYQYYHTLFYMPHCPMRLYCNVLWAHWDHIIFPSLSSSLTYEQRKSKKNPVLIFGNSFSAYEDRTISSEKRSDPTNGVFQIVPFAKEIPTNRSRSSKRRGDEIISDALRHLDMAFNDCNVISFPLLPSCNNSNDNGGGVQDGEHAVNNTDDQETMRSWPECPKEWIASQDSEENGELR